MQGLFRLASSHDGPRPRGDSSSDPFTTVPSNTPVVGELAGVGAESIDEDILFDGG